MIMILNEQPYPIMEEWGDLTERQKLMSVQILTSPTGLDAETDLAFKRVELLKVLSGMVQAGFDLWRERYIADDPENGELLFLTELEEKSTEATAFFFEHDEKKEKFSIALNMLVCPYPKLDLWEDSKGLYLSAKGRRPEDKPKPKFKDRMKQLTRVKAEEKPVTTLYAPSDDMDNLDFWELVQLFTFIDNFTKDGNIEHISSLFGLLYRPLRHDKKASDTDGRIALSDCEEESLRNTDFFAELPEMVLYLLWFWAVSCQQSYIKHYPSVFEVEFEGKTNEKIKKYGMAAVLMEMAQNDVTKHEAVKRLNAHDVLSQFAYLEDKRS